METNLKSEMFVKVFEEKLIEQGLISQSKLFSAQKPFLEDGKEKGQNTELSGEIEKISLSGKDLLMRERSEEIEERLVRKEKHLDSDYEETDNFKIDRTLTEKDNSCIERILSEKQEQNQS